MSSVYSVVEADKRLSPLCIPARRTPLASAGRRAWPGAQCPTMMAPSAGRRARGAARYHARAVAGPPALRANGRLLSEVVWIASKAWNLLSNLNGQMLNNYIHTGSKDDTSAHCNRIGECISSEWILRRRVALASHWQQVATKGGEQWLQYHNKIQW